MSQSTPQCPVCGAEQHDWLMCRDCTRKLRLDLEHLPGNWSDLQAALVRDVGGRTYRGGGKDKTHETPLPYNPAVAQVAWDVHNTLSTWVRELDMGDTQGLADNVRALANWLLTRLERIRGHQAVEEIHDELTYACRQVRIAIDIPPELKLAGTCPVCGKPVYATLSATETTCRECAKLGVETVINVPSQRLSAARAVQDELVTRPTLEHLITGLGFSVNPNTFKAWFRRHPDRPGPIQPERDDLDREMSAPDGRPLYRVGRVLDQVEVLKPRRRGA